MNKFLNNKNKQGQMDLVEVGEIWKQRNHVMDYLKPTVERKPTDFLDRFMKGKE